MSEHRTLIDRALVRDFAEIAPASADEDWERFRLFVRICADELSADVPALFDPRNPLLELEPSTAAFSELIELFVAADEPIWSAPDALGWSYQFFNSGEERKEMQRLLHEGMDAGLCGFSIQRLGPDSVQAAARPSRRL